MLSALVRPSARGGKTRFSAHTNPSRPGLKELFCVGGELVRKDHRGRLKTPPLALFPIFHNLVQQGTSNNL